MNGVGQIAAEHAATQQGIVNDVDNMLNDNPIHAPTHKPTTKIGTTMPPTNPPNPKQITKLILRTDPAMNQNIGFEISVDDPDAAENGLVVLP